MQYYVIVNNVNKFENKIQGQYKYRSLSLPRMFEIETAKTKNELKKDYKEIEEIFETETLCELESYTVDSTGKHKRKYISEFIQKFSNKQTIKFYDPRKKLYDNWGLLRISSSNYTFDKFPIKGKYEYEKTGEGVNVYVLDTGVDITHPDFEGRAENLWSGFSNYDDETGHGTHVASTIGGVRYGVAKKCTIKSVKVLGKNGGSYRTIIEGLEQVYRDHKNSSRPSVVNMSLGGPGAGNNPLQNAIKDLTDIGVVVVVAAGNDGKNLDGTYNVYPAMSNKAITVGATDYYDRSTDFSNYGETVDIWGPGSNIVAAQPNRSVASLSGTSMATPHVVGVIAKMMETIGRINSPKSVNNVYEMLFENSKKNRINWRKDHNNYNRLLQDKRS